MKNSARRVDLKNKTIVIMYMLYFGDMVSITPLSVHGLPAADDPPVLRILRRPGRQVAGDLDGLKARVRQKRRQFRRAPRPLPVLLVVPVPCTVCPQLEQIHLIGADFLLFRKERAPDAIALLSFVRIELAVHPPELIGGVDIKNKAAAGL